jgi:hypothetical protein
MWNVHEWCHGGKMLARIWNNPQIQIESSQNPKIQGRTMKENIRKLFVQKTIWKLHSNNSLCWAFLCEW